MDDQNGRQHSSGTSVTGVHLKGRPSLKPEPDAADRSVSDDLQRRLDITQELTGMGDWKLDTASGAVTWSRAIFSLLKRDPLSGHMTFDEFLFYYGQKDSERLLEAIETVVLENERTVVELRARLLDGENVRHSCLLVPLSDRQGVVTGINGFVRALGSAGNSAWGFATGAPRTRMVGVNTNDVVFRLLVPDGVCEYISPAVLDVSGRHPREWYRSPFLIREVVHPDWLDRFNRRFSRFMTGDAPQEQIFPIVDSSGGIRWILIRAVTLGDRRDGIFAIEGIASDITARVMEDSKRKRLIRQLRKTLSGMKILSGLLPICSFCKKIRDDRGLWTQIESFLTANCDLYFTHGLCPECLDKHYPEYNSNT